MRPNNKFIILILIFILSIASTSNAVVILVHGSFSASSIWHSSQGLFFRSLEETAKALDQTAVSFNWSGTPTYSEIKKAGQTLAKLIASYPKDESIILVGHSHGGNVINIASQNMIDIEAEISENASKITKEDLEKVFSGKKQEAQGPVPIKANKQNPDLDLIVTLRKPVEITNDKKHYKIDCVYLLGTPVDMNKYAPQMKVIKYLFNFYSRGDGIQSVAGFYDKQYPAHERITNIELKLKDSKTQKDTNPSHRDIHHYTVGKWLLLIPFNLQEEKAGDFQNFKLSKNCTIIFKEKEVPTYLAKN
jgi:hypothetical protein